MKVKTLLGYASGSAAGAILSFVTLPALAWSFSQDDVGKLVMLQVVCSLVAIVFSLGLDQAYVREYHEVEHKSALAKQCLLPGLYLLTLFCLLVLIFQQSLSPFFLGNNNSVYFNLAVIGCFVLYLERFFSVFIRMQEWVIAFSVTKVMPKLFFLSFVIAAYFYLQLQQLSLLLTAQVFCWFFAVVVMTVFLRRILKTALCARKTPTKLRPLLSFGLPLVLNGIAFWGLTYVDRLMLAQYASFAEVGLYAMAAGFAGVAMLFQQIFATVWHPTIYRWVSEGVQIERVTTISALLQLFSFLLIALIGCLSWLITHFLPQSYSAIEFIIVACMVQPLFLMISEVSGIGISVSRATKLLPVITIAALLLNVGLNLWLIPLYGAAGAAAATAVSTALYLLLKTELSWRLWRAQPRARLYLSMLLVVTGCIVQALSSNIGTLYFVAMWAAFSAFLLYIYKEELLKLKPLTFGLS